MPAMQSTQIPKWSAAPTREDTTQASSKHFSKPQSVPVFEETPLEIQSNNKLAVLNFKMNYDPKTN